MLRLMKYENYVNFKIGDVVMPRSWGFGSGRPAVGYIVDCDKINGLFMVFALYVNSRIEMIWLYVHEMDFVC